jgi:probable phosphomutase (TIGR03848 family)
MTTVLLVRHGLTALTGRLLLGWTPGVGLDERGRAQADGVAARLARVPLDAIVTSPLDRCRQTAEAIAAHRPGPDPASLASAGNGAAALVPGGPARVEADDRFGECHYGDWTGKELATLAKDPLWKVVQAHPSAVTFPGPEGEALRDTQARGVAAVRDWNARLGPDATWLVCSHGDVIRTIVADALGLHLDLYHRITVDPCSLTVIRYTELRPFVVRVNDLGGSVDDLLPPPPRPADEAAAAGAAGGGGAGGGGAGDPAASADSAPTDEASDAVVGGGAGTYRAR